MKESIYLGKNSQGIRKPYDQSQRFSLKIRHIQLRTEDIIGGKAFRKHARNSLKE